MIIDTISFKGHRCFKNHWAGFDSLKPINVIIGRNNTGKSHLLDLVEVLCSSSLGGRNWKFRCTGKLKNDELQSRFQVSTSSGIIGGNHWHDHGRYFVDQLVEWEIESGNVANISFFDKATPRVGLTENSGTQKIVDERLAMIGQILSHAEPPLKNCPLRRLSAERDIRPEPSSVGLGLGTTGQGATNIIRRFLTTTHPEYPRELIQNELLGGLNSIFGKDGNFTEIMVRQHDELAPSGIAHEAWEIFLGQSKKGLVPLSNSGSGLKTVILVLLNLLIMPKVDKKKQTGNVFCFEELENNLHPALLRRLFQFIEKYALEKNSHIFLTSHSSTALDFFGLSENAQIIHVTHDTESAHATTVSAHLDKLGVISELGLKPSDLLQANGIIWVEGPSDCVYLNKWISLYSNNELQEGRDYQCAFYGGALLARTQFSTPTEAESDLVNLFRINSNIIVICDSDKSEDKSPLKARVDRIKSEVDKLPSAHIWITAAKEIENYIPGDAFTRSLHALYPQAVDSEKITSTEIHHKSPDQFEQFFPSSDDSKKSYWQRHAKRKSYDKTDLAIAVTPHMTCENLSTRFDLPIEIQNVVNQIRSWNNS